MAAAGEAEHAFVSMLKHGFGPEGESYKMKKRKGEEKRRKKKESVSKDRDDVSVTKEMDANLEAW